MYQKRLFWGILQQHLAIRAEKKTPPMTFEAHLNVREIDSMQQLFGSMKGTSVSIRASDLPRELTDWIIDHVSLQLQPFMSQLTLQAPNYQ